MKTQSGDSAEDVLRKAALDSIRKQAKGYLKLLADPAVPPVRALRLMEGFADAARKMLANFGAMEDDFGDGLAGSGLPTFGGSQHAQLQQMIGTLSGMGEGQKLKDLTFALGEARAQGNVELAASIQTELRKLLPAASEDAVAEERERAAAALTGRPPRPPDAALAVMPPGDAILPAQCTCPAWWMAQSVPGSPNEHYVTCSKRYAPASTSHPAPE